jgi:hypothetical protein
MNKPPTGNPRSLLDRGNKAKIPKPGQTNEPIKIVVANNSEVNKEVKIEHKQEVTTENKENVKTEESKVEEVKTAPTNTATTGVPGQQKFMKRLQNSMKKFNTTTDNTVTPATNGTAPTSTPGTVQGGVPKKGMTKVAQSKKILDTAKMLENKLLKTESTETEVHIPEVNHNNNVTATNTEVENKVEESKLVEGSKDSQNDEVFSKTNEIVQEDQNINAKTVVKTNVRKPLKKAIV